MQNCSWSEQQSWLRRLQYQVIGPSPLLITKSLTICTEIDAVNSIYLGHTNALARLALLCHPFLGVR